MDNLWSWLTSLSSSGSRSSSLLLASSTSKSIRLTADSTAGSTVTLSLSLLGFYPSDTSKTLWLSNPFPLTSPHTPLIVHLLNQVTSLSPSASLEPLPELTSETIASSLSGSPDSPALLSLAFICRVFYLVSKDAPAEAGFMFFRSLPVSTLTQALNCHAALGILFSAAGPDREQRFMRSLGYMIAKWCLLSELGGGAGHNANPVALCPAYAVEAHGLWVVRGYAPVPAMEREGAGGGGGGIATASESVLRYALAHQQLEAVAQLEYSVSMQDPRFIRICIRVDNIRLHVARLGFGKDEYQGMEGERYYTSRVKVWVGPEMGSGYAVGPSIGRSTVNPQRAVELTRVVKGNLGFPGGKVNGVRAKARESAVETVSTWRWEQEVDGSAGVVEGVLSDVVTGEEVAEWRGKGGDPRGGMRKRYNGNGRVFSKGGGVVVAGDMVGERMTWRVGREMEGKVMKWRMWVKVWVTYSPNEVKVGYFETRSVEWREEVELPLVETFDF